MCLTGEPSGVSHRYVRLKSNSQDAVPDGPEAVHMTAYARLSPGRSPRSLSRLARVRGHAGRAYARHHRQWLQRLLTLGLVHIVVVLVSHQAPSHRHFVLQQQTDRRYSTREGYGVCVLHGPTCDPDNPSKGSFLMEFDGKIHFTVCNGVILIHGVT